MKQIPAHLNLAKEEREIDLLFAPLPGHGLLFMMFAIDYYPWRKSKILERKEKGIC